MRVLPTLALLAAAATARGDVAPLPTVPERVARSSAVVVGKVVRLEDRTVSAPRGPGLPNAEYQVAVVEVAEGLHGVKGLTHVRVGFVPRPRRGAWLMADNLLPGHEGCFFLSEHPSAPFYTLPMLFDVVARAGNPGFARELEQARRAARLLADPVKNLRAEDAQQRYLTAALLVVRYRTPPRVPLDRRGTEPVEARESALILGALAEADWKRPDPALGYQLAPQAVFAQLGVTGEDGFARPGTAREFPEAARKWLREHADSYRIRRFIIKKDKGDG